MEFPLSSHPSSSRSVQRLRQLISESPSSSTFNKNSVAYTTTKTRTRMMSSSSSSSSACLICTHSHPTNTALSFGKKKEDPCHFLESLFLEGSRRGDEGKEDFVFCSVCLPTVTRLLSLQEEVDDIKTRIQAVLKLQRQSFSSSGGEARKEEEKDESDSSSRVYKKEKEEEEEMYQEDLGDSFFIGKVKVEVLYDEDTTMKTTTTSPYLSGHEEEGDGDVVSQSDDEETPWCISPVPSPSSHDKSSPVEQKKRSRRTVIPRSRVNCPHCDKDYSKRAHLLRHMRSAHAASLAPSEHQVCPTCNRTFLSQDVYNAHSHPVPNDPSQVLYTCSLCTDKTFDTKAQYIDHGVKRHRGLSSCYFCSKVFKESASFQLHIRSHTLEKPYRCGRCRKEFADVTPYVRHISRSCDNSRIRGRGDHQCPVCGKMFVNAKSIRKHWKWVHRETTKVVLATTPSECPECGKTFPDKYQLKGHMKTVHHVDAILPLSQPQLTCHICNAVFLKREIFEAHVHPNPSDPTEVRYVCSICQTSYGSKDGYIRHSSKAHRDPMPFQCQFCGKDMKTRTALEKHGTFCLPEGAGCRECEQVFPTHAEMIDHERVTHKGLSSTKCAVCFKCFLNPHHLQRNVMTHK